MRPKNQPNCVPNHFQIFQARFFDEFHVSHHETIGKHDFSLATEIEIHFSEFQKMAFPSHLLEGWGHEGMDYWTWQDKISQIRIEIHHFVSRNHSKLPSKTQWLTTTVCSRCLDPILDLKNNALFIFRFDKQCSFIVVLARQDSQSPQMWAIFHVIVHLV